MPAYRLYRLDGAGKFMGADWIEADGDTSAVKEARQMVDGRPFELWERDRLVERFLPKGE